MGPALKKAARFLSSARRSWSTGIVVAGVGLLLSLPASPAAADHSWNGYHWRVSESPVEVNIVDSLSRGFRKQGVTPIVLEEWASAGAISLGSEPGSNERSVRKDCPEVVGAIRVCNADYGTGWFGKTELSVDEDHILGGSIRINNFWGTSSNYRRFVFCHELGHALGLDHRGEGDSCLNGGRSPDRHDRDMLHQFYSHDDTPPPDGGLLCLLLPCENPSIQISSGGGFGGRTLLTAHPQGRALGIR